MSGHSKWSNIKYQKETQDKKRGKVFGKLSRVISAAASEHGSDPTANAKLRMIVEKARALNMPKDNIERAIARGAGAAGEEQLESVVLEAVGPGGALLLVEAITDNRNRTVSEVKHVLETNGAKSSPAGSAQWAFQRTGFLTIDPKAQTLEGEALELALMDAGADDIEKNDTIEVVVQDPQKLDAVRRACEAQGIAVAETTLGWQPTQTVSLNENDKKAFQALIEALDNHDDVQEIWSNVSEGIER